MKIVIQSNFTREELLGALAEFYKTIAGKYKDRVEDFFKQYSELKW